jgi:Cd2+/Zn2+-exporting ATPase
MGVVTHVLAAGVELGIADPVTNIAGRGIVSALDRKTVQIGSWKLFAENPDHPQDRVVHQTIKRLEASGRTTMAISYDNQFVGVLGLADTPRPQAKAMLQKLRDLGVKHLVMLTGDNSDVAQQVGNELGLTDIRAELLPEDKLNAIRQLQAEYGAVALTGDGVNDAPALTAATVGIAMGGAGTAVALETADIALMADDLSKLPFAVGLSRASRRNIQQNLAIALGVIALLIATSVTGLIQLSGAVILHEGSTIVVVLNALRLLGYRPK